MQAIQLVLEETDFKLTRPAVVSGFVGHLDADWLVAAQFHRVEVDLDSVALAFLLRLLELPALLVVVPRLHIVPGRYAGVGLRPGELAVPEGEEGMRAQPNRGRLRRDGTVQRRASRRQDDLRNQRRLPGA